MKVEITDPATNSAKRKRLNNAISELVYDTYSELTFNEEDVLYINPETFEIGICSKCDVPKGCHYHPMEEVGIDDGEQVFANPEYLEMIVNHYFPD